MKAIVVEEPGGVDKLNFDEFKTPVPKEDEILVKVKATALNRADILQRKGKYPPPEGASPLLGLEIAGTVSAVGKNVTKWKAGDKVFGLIPGGGYAEYAVIHEDMAIAIPGNLSFEESAAIPEVFLTAFQAVVWYGKLKKKETILIHAGASGVGTAAIQLAKQFDAEIIVTASKGKHDACLKLGADKAIDYKSAPFEAEVMNFTQKQGVDVIIDFVAGPYFNQNINCLKPDGRMVLLATLGGGEVEKFDLRKILRKRLSITGSTLRARSRDYQIKLTDEFAHFALDRFKEGKLKSVIDKVYNWKDVKEAHQFMEDNKNIGKLVLKIE